MKTPGIPELVDPTKGCEKRLTFEGSVSTENLPRFTELQMQDVGELETVKAKYTFGRDEQNLKVAVMSYSTTAKLPCQRCLGRVDYKIEGEVTLVFSDSEDDLEMLPKSYEPVLVENQEVNLYQALEDELLLSLPMFAYHDDEHCSSELNEMKSKADEQRADNPFAVLGELLKK
ncbi:metal-binding protein [Hahella sp. CCB-MM4]|uniref:YceD family protein n=1 Tax=Hahella sp. (strain CCB-MM4) TaxID=1926491 RepID=UPI000B9B488A|nr:YceD family protein [Hahella sp. CCB-MM4]OZG71303.1 metal-binding protein [Hahella sp. CCB-MM4]